MRNSGDARLTSLCTLLISPFRELWLKAAGVPVTDAGVLKGLLPNLCASVMFLSSNLRKASEDLFGETVASGQVVKSKSTEKSHTFSVLTPSSNVEHFSRDHMLFK
ncbi:uncharacterized [Tachysurus ichikawai]